MYRRVIAERDSEGGKQHGAPFAKLKSEQQDEGLRALDEGKFPLEAVPARFFFNLLLDNTIEGFFSDPIYGGNRDKIGWKLVGFPGVAAVYTQHIEKYGVPYDALPISIVDILEGKSVLDETGHPEHGVHVRKD